MATAPRYLIGKGELLTFGIDAPKKKPSDKKHPYTLAEAKATLIPQLEAANAVFSELPDDACPDDQAVARITLHPAYIAKSYFPRVLLQQAGLVSVGSRNRRIRPRKVVAKTAPAEADTTELFVAGTRSALRRLVKQARLLTADMPAAHEFAQIESIEPMTPADRLRPAGEGAAKEVFEVGLHIPPGDSAGALRAQFSAYAQECGFRVDDRFEFEAGRLLFVPVEGPKKQLAKLALFTLIRVVRPMPRLRSARPTFRSTKLPVAFELPSAEPLSREPKVAVLDGGLPEDHVLGGFVRRYFLADEDSDDVQEYTEHGLAVTSALLFGPIEPGQRAERPYAAVDHHRVLDAESDSEDPYELYRTLGHVEAVLLSQNYQFINLSLGPDLCVEDSDVHAWTAVIDHLLSDGSTLMSVAVGNNGEGDEALGLNRIQVPADSVNALCVGAVDRAGAGWSRAAYSACGPGRSPGRRKPDVVAFGGSPKEYFHVVAPGKRRSLATQLGTSFAAPLALRSAVGIRAILGSDVHPLTIKALLVHSAEDSLVEGAEEVGWGRVPSDLNSIITCGDGVARIIYQGELTPGKYLRAPVPLPPGGLQGNVNITATFCYATPVDPQDASAYTKAGLDITFRPDITKFKPKAKQPNSYSFFPSNEWRTEAEMRNDLGKWETLLHAEHTFRGTRLNGSVFDVHYNARDGGANAGGGATKIRYALVVTVKAPKHIDLYQEILRAHAKLEALEPQLSLPIRT